LYFTQLLIFPRKEGVRQYTPEERETVQVWDFLMTQADFSIVINLQANIEENKYQ
jgi:hypothetical protein